MVSIANDSISVGINEIGAELASLKSRTSDIEYIWKADSEYWGRHSCILFPVIGAVNGGQIRIDGQLYPMKKHGLVRDLPFALQSQEPDRAVFTLDSNDELKKMYPFDWNMQVIYEVVHKRCRIIYKVENKNNGIMPFSLGAHPGINCPLSTQKKRSDYHLRFDQMETQDSPLLSDEGLILSRTKRVLEGSARINITDDIFDEDALILTDYNSSMVSIVDDEDNVCVTVGIEGFTHLGIWSKNRTSPFVCIEPWMGHADPVSYKGEFKDKPGNVLLPAGEIFTCEHWIEITE